MNAIVKLLQKNFPKNKIELRIYSGKDPKVEKMEKFYEVYEIYKDSKNSGIVLYEFNQRGEDERFFGMIDTLTKMIKLKL